MKPIPLLISAALCLTVSAPASAHHSYAAFDRTKTITLKGAIESIEWTNPHIYIVLVARPAQGGAPARWTIEGNPPAAMERQGWKKGAAKPGDVITLVINPLRNGQVGGHYVSALLPGGLKAMQPEVR